MNDVTSITIKDTTSNPAPLGLLGFGMTTVLLNLHNAGLYGISTMILAMGIFIGGFAQIFAGWMEWKKGNTFGTTAFSMYGLFWHSLVAILVLPKLGWGAAPTSAEMGFYLMIWGIFTAMMFVGTLRLNRALQVVFSSLTVLFFLLAIGDFLENPVIKTIAGIEGIFCGGSAIYAAVAQVLNEVYGKTVLPLGAVGK
ncbi:MAG: acetate uptake transporter [bacterium]|nr:acetate uptake transporter [bacterium]